MPRSLLWRLQHVSGNMLETDALHAFRDSLVGAANEFWESPEHIAAEWLLPRACKNGVWWKWADWVRWREVTYAFDREEISTDVAEFTSLLSEPQAFSFITPNER